MIKKLFIMTTMLFLLTGCVKGNVEIEFVDKNEATLSIEILLKKELLKTYNLSLNDLKDKLNNSELNNWIYQEINRNNYSGFKLQAPSNINKSLLTFFKENKKEGTYQVIIDSNTINNIFNTSEIEDINNYSINNLKDMGLEFELRIKMPGSITKTSYGKIKDNQVRINLLEYLVQEKPETITIVSNKQSNMMSTTNIFIFITLIVILFFILRKRH